MPLIDVFQDAGDGIVTSIDKNKRIYRVGEADNYVDYLETQENESRSWVGLTKRCALDQVALSPQPAGAFESYSWSAQEDVRAVGSYTVTRNYTKTKTEVYTSTPVPALNKPTISSGSPSVGDYVDFQNTGVEVVGTITITGNISSTYQNQTKLYYRYTLSNMGFDPGVGAGQKWPYSRYLTSYPSGSVAFSSTDDESTSVQLTVPGRYTRHATKLSDSATSGSGLRLAFVIKVDAYSEVTLLSGTYITPTTTVYVHCKTGIW